MIITMWLSSTCTICCALKWWPLFVLLCKCTNCVKQNVMGDMSPKQKWRWKLNWQFVGLLTANRRCNGIPTQHNNRLNKPPSHRLDQTNCTHVITLATERKTEGKQIILKYEVLFFIVEPCVLILSKSFYFTDGCTIYLFSSKLKFTLKYTLTYFNVNLLLYPKGGTSCCLLRTALNVL